MIYAYSIKPVVLNSSCVLESPRESKPYFRITKGIQPLPEILWCYWDGEQLSLWYIFILYIKQYIYQMA